MSAPCRRPQLSAKRWWRSCWPMRSRKNSAAIRWRSSNGRCARGRRPFGSSSHQSKVESQPSLSFGPFSFLMIRPILRYGEVPLHQPAVDVAAIDDDLQRLVDDMIETMYAAPGVGLAATQIGVSQRVFGIDVSL